jgi:phospholipid/cholesterol/gamma-HCH transport system substrate-binding protein
MKKKGREVWVGVFVVIGVFLLVLMTLKIEKFRIGGEAGNRFYIYFDSALGLDRNSPVRVAGVHVGNVEKVTLERGKAKVAFRVPAGVILHQEAKAFIKSEGFLGERYVEISPGDPGSPRLEPNGVVEQGAPPVDMERFLSEVGAIGEEIKDVAKPLGDVLKAVDAKKVEKMIDSMDKFSGQLDGIAGDARRALQKGESAFSRLEEIGEKVNRGEGLLGKLVTDETLYGDTKKTVETAKEAVESMKGTAERLKDISETIERGEGTLGKLIKDESLYQNAKETLQSIKGVVERVEKGEGTLGKLMGDDTLVKEAEKTMKKVQRAAEGVEEQTPITVLGTIIGIFF